MEDCVRPFSLTFHTLCKSCLPFFDGPSGLRRSGGTATASIKPEDDFLQLMVDYRLKQTPWLCFESVIRNINQNYAKSYF